MWKSINNNYAVNTSGEVVNIKRGNVLSNDLNSKGYKRVKFGNRHHFIHRLVAVAFIPNPLNLPQVNHKDYNKLNNYVSNLEWCDNVYNNKQSHLSGLRKPKGPHKKKNDL